MDGNGRWASRRGLPRIAGHKEGAESVRDVVRAARALGTIECLTLYAFSSQNWDRPPDEVKALMELLRDYLVEERAEIMDNDIRLTAIGRIDRLPALVRAPLKSWGGSIRVNMLGLMILRFDYTKPIDRPLKRNYWTISLGPTF